MDGSAIILLVQVPVTIFTVAIGFWKVHDKLRDRIDLAKDEAVAAKNASKNVETKFQGFMDVCQAHRDGFDVRVSRVEKVVNHKKD